MNIKSLLLGAGFLFSTYSSVAAAEFSLDASGASHPISPFIYGKNHGISQQIGKPTSNLEMTRHRDAGYKMIRLNNGNNSTKYNWRKKLSSHPDWYNNVYSQSWDQSAQEVEQELPGVSSMYALSLLGWVADDDSYNFNDWLYNGGQWWDGVHNNWAGISTPISAAGEEPTEAHNPNLYLVQQSADTTVAILDHWFGNGAGQLGLDSNLFRYWNMDNEADIWSGTHDDVIDSMPIDTFIQKYVEMAKKARAKFPGIKLVGPVLTNEWQWYFWELKKISSGGQEYTATEYFIKRIAEEETTSGVKLLDVFDVHYYPGYSQEADKSKIFQAHRIWFDTSYIDPKANGVSVALGGTKKQYYFQRVRDYLEQYMGANHGVTLGITECGSIDGVKNDASGVAVWYASHLGEFASAGDVEVFLPWTIYEGMFETIHLFTSHAKEKSLKALNSSSHLVSVYPSMNAAGDSLTLMVVNRNLSGEEDVTIDLSGFTHGGSWAPTFDLAHLNGETFVSKAENALYANAADVSNGTISLTVPKVSVTAIVLSTTDPGTKLTFEARDSVSVEPEDTTSTEGLVKVWDYTDGLQVEQPDGSAGGWWYAYADTLSTINSLDASEVSVRKAIYVKFDAVQNAEQTWNYAGLGFSWGNEAIDLSAYDQICVEYKSTVGLRASIQQPAGGSSVDDFMSVDAAFPASDNKTLECVDWDVFGAGDALDLENQLRFQMQAEESAEWYVYQIALHKDTTLSDSTENVVEGMFPQAWIMNQIGSELHLSFVQSINSVQIFDLQGREVELWKGHSLNPVLDVSALRAGVYLVKVEDFGVQSILIH